MRGEAGTFYIKTISGRLIIYPNIFYCTVYLASMEQMTNKVKIKGNHKVTETVTVG